MKDWDPDTALEALSEESRMAESEEGMATRIFKEGLPHAVLAITHLAVNSSNERTRLAAAQYVVERNLGRLADRPPLNTNDPWAALLNECVAEGESSGGGTSGGPS